MDQNQVETQSYCAHKHSLCAHECLYQGLWQSIQLMWNTEHFHL